MCFRDSVLQRLLCAKLYALGVSELMLEWLRTLLTKRFFLVRIRDVISEKSPVRSEVSHFLSLFTIYQIFYQIFVDDTKMDSSTKTLQIHIFTTRQELNFSQCQEEPISALWAESLFSTAFHRLSWCEHTTSASKSDEGLICYAAIVAKARSWEENSTVELLILQYFVFICVQAWPSF